MEKLNITNALHDDNQLKVYHPEMDKPFNLKCISKTSSCSYPDKSNTALMIYG